MPRVLGEWRLCCRALALPAEEVSFGGVGCEFDGPVVCRGRFVGPPCACEQVREGGVVWLVVDEVDVGECVQPGFGAIERAHCDGPVYGYDQVRLDCVELVVQGDDL